MESEINVEGLFLLRDAIVLQAFTELKKAYKNGWLYDASNLENWFRSDEFRCLTLDMVDGNKVIEHAKENCRKQTLISHKAHTKKKEEKMFRASDYYERKR